jgi:hypothetical protein
MRRIWYVTAQRCCLRFIVAEPPCMKGEIQCLWFVIGWQR